MDVSWNPLVALYFSVKDNADEPGRVIAIASQARETRLFDSDKVSLPANLCYTTPRERDIPRQHKRDDMDAFNALPEAKRLVSFVEPEKSYFENVIKPADLFEPVLVRPKLDDKRVAAQNGTFAIFGLGSGLSLDAYASLEIASIRVKAASKGPIARELDRLGFDDQSMFPELEMAAKYVNSKFFLPSPK